MAGIPGRGGRPCRAEPGALPDAQRAAAGPRAAGGRAEPAAAPTTSTRSRPRRSRRSPATSTSSGGSAPTSGGTPRSWSTGRSGPGSGSAGTSPPTPRPRRCTRWGSTTSSAATTHAGGGDQIYFQGHASPGIYARAFLEGRLTEDQLDGFRQELSHRGHGGGLPSYPHPRLMPDFWEFPTVSMGLGAAQRDLPGPVQPLPAQPRDQGHQRSACVGLPRRRRDGRAGVPRRDRRRGPRGAGQPHLRRQLQPAAPRRAGPRQRQDHPGAGGVLPRRRLERHQGHLGPRMGPAPRRRRRRRTGRPDEHHARRGLPDLQGRVRGVRARALLRPRPPHPQPWSRT